jgi:hypothetical protein
MIDVKTAVYDVTRQIYDVEEERRRILRMLDLESIHSLGPSHPTREF